MHRASLTLLLVLGLLALSGALWFYLSRQAAPPQPAGQAATPAARTPAQPEDAMSDQPAARFAMKKATVLLTVDAIEPCVAFWSRFGYELVMSVPEEGADGERLGFATLTSGGVELMYQTWTSVEADVTPIRRPAKPSPTFVFIEVEGVNELIEELTDDEIVHGPRETFYGMREIVFNDPAGHMFVFAEPVGEAPRE